MLAPAFPWKLRTWNVTFVVVPDGTELNGMLALSKAMTSAFFAASEAEAYGLGAVRRKAPVA